MVSFLEYYQSQMAYIMWIEAIRATFEWIKTNSTALVVWAYMRLLALLGMERQLRNMAELKSKKMENKIGIDKENADKSDADIVADAIRESRISGDS